MKYLKLIYGLMAKWLNCFTAYGYMAALILFYLV
jgi:hypothetical protein